MRRFFVLLLLVPLGLFSNDIRLSEASTVSILTYGPGDYTYQAFGHTAIRVWDPTQDFDVIFNFGTFNFEDEGFYLKFIRGDLNYYLSTEGPTPALVAYYKKKSRTLVEQVLDLNLLERQSILDDLVYRLNGENKYAYRFIDQNCTTKTADLINDIILATQAAHSSKLRHPALIARSEVNSFLKPDPLLTLGINIVFGVKTDAAIEDCTFLPTHLYDSLNEAMYNGKPLVKKVNVLSGSIDQLYASAIVERNTGSTLLILIGLGLLIAISLYFYTKKSRSILANVFCIVLGLTGLVLGYIWIISAHTETYWNHHLLLFNPLWVLLPFLKNRRLLKLILVALALSIIAYVIIALFDSSYASLFMLLFLLAIVLFEVMVLYFSYRKLSTVHNTVSNTNLKQTIVK